VVAVRSQELGKQLGGSFIDNRGGAGGNIGMENGQSPADGYSVVLALTSQLAINQALYPKLRYDALNDFVPITGSAPYFLAVNASVR
jgi:tripartite-type tricarboxylate transporter receptor subunit TctC